FASWSRLLTSTAEIQVVSLQPFDRQIVDVDGVPDLDSVMMVRMRWDSWFKAWLRQEIRRLQLQNCCFGDFLRKKAHKSKIGGSQVNMVEWVWELYVKGKVIEAADPKLRGDFDEKQMDCLLIVGLWCAHPNYNSRPSIQQVIQTLNFEVAVPILPSKMRTNSSPLTISVSGSSSSIGYEGGQVDDSGPDYITNCSLIIEYLQQLLLHLVAIKLE
ncbi:PREDICTED: L-type lectin-domain, partial [Prunus dulcis]